jgi:hypothetical protein
VQFDTWWFDEQKAAALAAAISGEGGERGVSGVPPTGIVLTVAAGVALLGFFVFRRALRRREA